MKKTVCLLLTVLLLCALPVTGFAAEGDISSYGVAREGDAAGLALSLCLGFLIAFLVVKLMEYSLRSVFQATTAREYVNQGGLKLTQRSDRFLNRTTTRRKIEKQTTAANRTGRP